MSKQLPDSDKTLNSHFYAFDRSEVDRALFLAKYLELRSRIDIAVVNGFMTDMQTFYFKLEKLFREHAVATTKSGPVDVLSMSNRTEFCEADLSHAVDEFHIRDVLKTFQKPLWVQLKQWQEFDRRYDLDIRPDRFAAAADLPEPEILPDEEPCLTVLCHGRPGPGGNIWADPMLTAKITWDRYLLHAQRNKLAVRQLPQFGAWLDRNNMAPYRYAKRRPCGFFPVKIYFGHADRDKTVENVRLAKYGIPDASCGSFEVLQFLCITHPEFAEKLDGDEFPNMLMGDMSLSFRQDGRYFASPCVSFDQERRCLVLGAENFSETRAGSAPCTVRSTFISGSWNDAEASGVFGTTKFE